MIRSMKRDADPDLDVQAHCRSLALQQLGMLTRIAEIGMRLVEAEGAKAIAQAERPEAGQAEAAAPRADAPAAGAASTSGGWSRRCGALPGVGPDIWNNDGCKLSVPIRAENPLRELSGYPQTSPRKLTPVRHYRR